MKTIEELILWHEQMAADWTALRNGVTAATHARAAALIRECIRQRDEALAWRTPAPASAPWLPPTGPTSAVDPMLARQAVQISGPAPDAECPNADPHPVDSLLVGAAEC